MPIYEQRTVSLPNPKKRFHFIHIPRTAGRFLDAVIEDNNFTLEHSTLGCLEGTDIIHLHRELYEKYLNVEGIPSIAVIRNPIDKFFGASPFLKRMYGDDIQEQMEDPLMFSMMLENFPLPQAVNWFRPQADFLADGTNVWRFEDGFGEDFEDWVSGILEVPFKVRDVPYEKLSTDESNKLDRTDKLIDNIRLLCRKDIEQFYPELATPLQEGGQAKT